MPGTAWPTLLTIMRLVLFGFFVSVGAIYSAGTIYFDTQEWFSQSISKAVSVPDSRLHHPEANLALIRASMEAMNFSPRVGALVQKSLRQVPSFYQPAAYLAIYHTNRFEETSATHQAFEAAVRRYPANGRLHLDYARWLFLSQSLLPGVPDPESPDRDLDLRQEGENHLRIAMSLELDLTREGIETLRRQQIPANRWADVVPDDNMARRLLVVALADDGYKEEALGLLRPLLPQIQDVRYCRQAANWAMAWGDPGLALEAVGRWQELDRRGGRQGVEAHEAGLYLARAYLALGEANEAYDVFRNTLKDVGPSSSSGLKMLCAIGNEYLRLRRPILAESIFIEATSYSPTYVPALHGLARAYRQAGKEQEAVEQYHKLLVVDPDNERAQTELTRLTRQRTLRSRD